MNTRLSHSELGRGLDLFNQRHFFEAHEVLEDVWRSLAREQPARRHVQGLVQLAVTFHHHSRGNYVGARSLLERALRNLDGSEGTFRDLDIARLRADLEPWRHYLDEHARPSSYAHDDHTHAEKEKPQRSLTAAPALPMIRRKMTRPKKTARRR